MESKLHQSRFLRHIPALLFAVLHVVLGPQPPPYSITATIDTVTPTCVMLTWELRPKMGLSNGSRITTIKQWRIVLTNMNRRMETVNELILAGSRSNITLGPFALGSDLLAEVHLHKFNFITVDGQKRSSSGRSTNQSVGLIFMKLPRGDKSCSKLYGQRTNPCSECVCLSSAFTGPNCEDPNFKPHNVSAWPLSDGSLHIQWKFNAIEHQRSLDRTNFYLSNISLMITEANTGSLVMADSVPLNYESEAYGYEVRQALSPGVEYDIVVGVGAAGLSSLVVANSSVRTFIPEGVIGTGEGGVLMLSGAEVPSIIVGVAVGSCLLASLASAIITAVCLQARSKRIRRPVPVRAPNPNSNLPLSPSQIPPSMERNPAYGQLLTLSGDSNTTDDPNQSGQLDVLTGGYDNTGSSSGMYLYITQ